MGTTPEIEAEIIRLFSAEGWRRGTIAKQLGLHHSVVTRVLAANAVTFARQQRISKLDPYLPFIQETLEKYPRLNAARLHQMVKQRGFTGSKDYFRHYIKRIRPKPKGEAFLRLTTLPGEQGQVDWGCFGKLKIGNAERRLLAFVMVLSWSRRMFVRFYLGDHTANFLRGHVEAFEHWQSLPRELLYDNLKTAVVERIDSAIRFNSDLLKLSAHYRFAPHPVPVARPTSKGRVERAIQYVRSSFFAARQFDDLDDLNRQATQWCINEASERRCPGNKMLTVEEAFELERPSMLRLPDTPYPVYDRKPVSIGKTPYARFDGNDYSVPHEFARRTLLVEATVDRVSIVDGIDVIAEHPRSYDKDLVIECGSHVDALISEKRNASKATGMNRLLNVTPSSSQFFKLAAERGHNMGRLTQSLIGYLELYGSSELEAALNESLSAGTIHTEALRHILERRRLARGLPPPISYRPLKGRTSNDVIVTPKSLNTYDQLLQPEDDEQ